MAVALASDPVPETSAKAIRLLKQVNWLGGAWVPGGLGRTGCGGGHCLGA